MIGDDIALCATDVTVNYGEVRALDAVSLSVRFGEIRALIGTNGSGKSTLFHALMGITRCDAGSVELAAARPGDVAFVPQHQHVDWTFPLSVREVVASGRFAGPRGRWLGRLNRADRASVDKALERTGLSGYASRQIGQLSGGQKKRVFVARSIAGGARIMLLDEPFAGVDYLNEDRIAELLRELAEEGTAILVSTHNIAGLSTLADTATLLNRRVIADGPVDEVATPENLALAFGGERAWR
ncbi:metal ABC transporter ATP-binding protein [Corynebacterium sanguinis]|uniref:metal ABC transporter ATP-binding protein n=1 Tax=Corynebacterium sanguinis TaxID=2594913 RepID=UPI00223B2BAD|nr:metal ABC transporter ATP-binding protein [Corynebacterium sanguinis]MCT2287681.1 metal ABC transporter ATP-binding protein [Corynebacterium sanguinis]